MKEQLLPDVWTLYCVPKGVLIFFQLLPWGHDCRHMKRQWSQQLPFLLHACTSSPCCIDLILTCEQMWDTKNPSPVVETCSQAFNLVPQVTDFQHFLHHSLKIIVWDLEGDSPTWFDSIFRSCIICKKQHPGICKKQHPGMSKVETLFPGYSLRFWPW